MVSGCFQSDWRFVSRGIAGCLNFVLHWDLSYRAAIIDFILGLFVVLFGVFSIRVSILWILTEGNRLTAV